jgi:uncharacterized protein with von Willebrand factor type A (vWA) domain
MADAAYYREWRRTHPTYRKRQNELRNERRKRNGREDRSSEYRRRGQERLRRNADNGALAESSLIRKAISIARARKSPDRRTALWDDTYEDLVGVVIVALCEGTDPGDAMTRFMRDKWAWDYRRLPLHDAR